MMSQGKDGHIWAQAFSHPSPAPKSHSHKDVLLSLSPTAQPSVLREGVQQSVRASLGSDLFHQDPSPPAIISHPPLAHLYRTVSVLRMATM